jgi:S-adenosylmethionine decarboxylase
MPDVQPAMVFGVEVVLDVDKCNPDTLDDEAAIRRYAGDLVDLLGMNAYGEPLTPHFGHGDPRTAGFSLLQWIETSSILGHFSPHLRRAHLNIFSCQDFDTGAAAAFTASFFGGEIGQLIEIVR